MSFIWIVWSTLYVYLCPRLKRGRRKKNFTKTIYIAPNPRQFSHQDRVKRAHPKICSFYDHFSLGLLLAKGFYFDYARVLFDDWFPVFSLGGQGRAEGPAHCPLQGRRMSRNLVGTILYGVHNRPPPDLNRVNLFPQNCWELVPMPHLFRRPYIAEQSHPLAQGLFATTCVLWYFVPKILLTHCKKKML